MNICQIKCGHCQSCVPVCMYLICRIRMKVQLVQICFLHSFCNVFKFYLQLTQIINVPSKGHFRFQIHVREDGAKFYVSPLTVLKGDIFIDVSNNSDGSSAQQCAHDPIQFAPSDSRVYPCPCGMFGRYVRIRYPVEKSTYLILCEVQIQSGGKSNSSLTVAELILVSSSTNMF